MRLQQRRRHEVTVALRHPGGSSGFRVREGGRSFVHLTDTELAVASGGEIFERCREFCAGADLLSHDAQYLEGELAERAGRGHSSVEEACALAEAAQVKSLALFHHDPSRTDSELDEIGRESERRLAGSGVRCLVAAEGMRTEV